MTTYTFEPGDYVLSRMQIAAATLGGSAVIISPTREDGTPGVPYLAVSVPDGTSLAAVQAAYVNARKKRNLIDIYLALRDGTSTADKTAIWANISSGSPRKYFLGEGNNKAAIVALDWAASDSGATGNALTRAQMRLVAMYVQDNVQYLVNPSWRPALNIPGDEPA